MKHPVEFDNSAFLFFIAYCPEFFFVRFGKDRDFHLLLVQEKGRLTFFGTATHTVGFRSVPAMTGRKAHVREISVEHFPGVGVSRVRSKTEREEDQITLNFTATIIWKVMIFQTTFC